MALLRRLDGSFAPRSLALFLCPGNSFAPPSIECEHSSLAAFISHAGDSFALPSTVGESPSLADLSLMPWPYFYFVVLSASWIAGFLFLVLTTPSRSTLDS